MPLTILIDALLYNLKMLVVLAGGPVAAPLEAGGGEELEAEVHADPSFLDMMAAARAEYESIAPQSHVTTSSSARAYRLDGTSSADDTRGIVIENRQKTVRR